MDASAPSLPNSRTPVLLIEVSDVELLPQRVPKPNNSAESVDALALGFTQAFSLNESEKQLAQEGKTGY